MSIKIYIFDDNSNVVASYLSAENPESYHLRLNEALDVNNVINDNSINPFVDSNGLYNYQIVGGIIQPTPQATKDLILAARADDISYVLSPSQMIIAKALFNHENRIRALEGKGPITVSQFKTGLLNL
jgi:hypothetical protein